MKHADGPAADSLYGLHPVLDAIEGGKRRVDRVLVSRERGGRNLGRLLRAARQAGVPVTYLPREVLARKAGARAVHQGVVAIVAAVPYAEADALCRDAAADPRGLLLLLDGVEDPRNLGAIARTAAAVGASGVLLAKERTVGVTPAAAKTAAGALERMPVAREPRMGARIGQLRGAGFRIVALDPRAPTSWDRATYEGRLAVVAGGEGAGLRRGLLEAADLRVAIPLAPGVESLNVSVAVGVLLYEIARQRRESGKGPAA